MEVVRSGFILYTLKYKECVSFYEKTMGLKVLYRKEALTCFDFYGSYLMVEIDDETELTEPSIPSRDRTCIRFNVSDVKKVCAVLDQNVIEYSYNEFDWGTIAKFRDPDGNLIGIRSAKEFEADLMQKG